MVEVKCSSVLPSYDQSESNARSEAVSIYHSAITDNLIDGAEILMDTPSNPTSIDQTYADSNNIGPSRTQTPHQGYGKVHAVPVLDIVGSSSWLIEVLYRFFEILFAALALILTLPLMLLEALLIRWDSPGPALFFHTRPGQSRMIRGSDLEDHTDLQPPPGGYEPDRLYYAPNYFRLVKFRTMYSDARNRFPHFYAYNFSPAEFHQQYGTHQNDPRVTSIGGILRTLSLDELPNLWCVLKGEMRLVGPRAEAPEVLRYYAPEEMYKFACKPGITGLAQINGRGLLNWGETLEWDLRYIRTRSVWLDLKILLITIYYVITRRGAF